MINNDLILILREKYDEPEIMLKVLANVETELSNWFSEEEPLKSYKEITINDSHFQYAIKETARKAILKSFELGTVKE